MTNFEESFRFVQALLANKALYVLTFGIFLSENPIVRTLAIVFDSIFSVGKYFVRTFHVLTVSYAWYLTDVKYFVRLLCKLTIFASRSQRAEEWGGYRRGKPAASQRAGVSLLKITRFEPKMISKCRLVGELNFNPKKSFLNFESKLHFCAGLHGE